MSALPRRPLVNAAVILGVGIFALGAGPSIPFLSRAGLRLVEQLGLKLDPTPSAFSGDGSPEQPWQRWKSKPAPPPEPVVLLSVEQGEQGWFSTFPPAPVDCAVVFKRLREAGHRNIGCGYLMAWDEANAVGVNAVRLHLDSFDTAVLGLPLSRGAAGEPLPSAFLRLSVEADKVEGDVSALPQVNKLAAPRAELGGERSLAGFTVLENERIPEEGPQPLLARWGDRIVFALPLASEIAALGISPSEVKITLGREIRVGLDGPVVPIDSLGRAVPVHAGEVVDTPLWKVASGEIPVPSANFPLLIRDSRPDLPRAEELWSKGLPDLAQAIRSAPRYERPLVLHRLPVLAEMALILLIAFFTAWATWVRNIFWRLLVVVMAAGFAGELLYLLSSERNLWLPPLPIAGMCGASLLLSFYWERSKQPAANPRPWESPDFQPPVRPVEPEPAPAPPKRPRPAPVPVPVPAPVPVAVAAPEPAPLPLPIPAPALPLTRVKFVNGSVVLPESARAVWGLPEQELPATLPIMEEPAAPLAEEETEPEPEPAPEPEVEHEAEVEPEPEAAPAPEPEPEPEHTAPPTSPQPTPPAKKSPPKKPSKKRRKKR